MVRPEREWRAGARFFLLPPILFSILCLVPYVKPSGDAFGYARGLIEETRPPELNPNRLLLLPSLRVLHGAVVSVAPGNGPSPLSTLLWTARLSYLAAGILFLVAVRTLFPGGALAACLCLGLLASHAILTFGSDGEPILFGHLPLLAGAATQIRSTNGPGPIGSLAAGVLYGLSILLLVNNALVVVPILAVTLIGSGHRGRLKGLLLACGAILFPAAAFAAVHAVADPGVSCVSWVSSYSGGGFRLSYGGSPVLSLLRVAFGFGDAFLPVRGAARLVRQWTEGSGSVVAHPGDFAFLCLWAATVLTAVALTLVAARRAMLGSRRDRGVATALLLSLAMIAAFNIRWIGSDSQFWVPALPLLWLLWGYAFRGQGRTTLGVAAAAVTLLLPLGLLVSILPARTDRSEIEEREAVLRIAPQNSLVVSPGLDWLEGSGFFDPPPGIELLSLWRQSAEPAWAENREGYYHAVDSTVAAAVRAGRAVYLKGVISEPFPDGVPWREMRPRGFELERLQALFSKYEWSPPILLASETYRRLSAGADSGVGTMR